MAECCKTNELKGAGRVTIHPTPLHPSTSNTRWDNYTGRDTFITLLSDWTEMFKSLGPFDFSKTVFQDVCFIFLCRNVWLSTCCSWYYAWAERNCAACGKSGYKPSLNFMQEVLLLRLAPAVIIQYNPRSPKIWTGSAMCENSGPGPYRGTNNST